MRKTLSVITIGLLCLSFFSVLPPNVLAVDTLFSVDPSSIVDPTLVPGSVFRVNLTVCEVQNLWGFQFVLSYNTSCLTATNYGIFLPFQNFAPSEINDSLGEVALAAYTFGGDQEGLTAIDPKAVCWIEFSVDAVGSTILDLRGPGYIGGVSLLVDTHANSIAHVDVDGFFSNSGAPPKREVGVKVGDWIRYAYLDYYYSSNDPHPPMVPPKNYPEWLNASIIGIQDKKNVSFNLTILYDNDTRQTVLSSLDVDTGAGSVQLLFIASNLTQGDALYTQGQFQNLKINETIFGNYLGVTRQVNHLNATMKEQQTALPYDVTLKYDIYWDRITGINLKTVVERRFVNETNNYVTIFRETTFAIETNLFGPVPALFLSAYVEGTEPPQPRVVPEPITDPLAINWFEIHPVYDLRYRISQWIDLDADGEFNAWDKVVLDDGSIYSVEKIVYLLHWTYTDPASLGEGVAELIGSPPAEGFPDPLMSYWHQIYKLERYTRNFWIYAWEDRDGDGLFSIGDAFVIYYSESEMAWAIVDGFSTGIVLSARAKPVAVLDVDPDPPVVSVGSDVWFSGANSFDPDGEVVGFLFDFGDGASTGWLYYPIVATTHAFSVAGEYAVRLRVMDDDGLLSEWSDPIVVSVHVLTRLCDLSITSKDISFSDNAILGDTVTITAIIHNTGEANAAEVLVQFFDDQNLIGESTVSLSHGSEAAVLMDMNAERGFHQIGVLIDPENSRAEMDEDNNQATRSLFVDTWIRGGIVLTGAVNPSVANPGSTVTVSGTAVYDTDFGSGIGVAGADIRVKVGGQEWLTHTIAGGTYAVEVTAPYSLGDYQVEVMITDYTFWEKIERDLIVEPVVGLDLALGYYDLSFSSASPVEGDLVTINVVVHNVGTEDAASVQVGFYCDGLPIEVSAIAAVPTGGSEVATIIWGAPSWGWHTITVIVDPFDALVESNELNNVAFRRIYVYPSEPDLALKNLALSDSTPLINQGVLLSVDVANVGGVHAVNVVLYFYDNGVLFGEYEVPFIAWKGGVERVRVEHEFGSVGWHELTVEVDPENVIGEAVEINNHLAMIVFVRPPAPDLAISRGDITFSDSSPTDGDQITIYAQIHNIGELDAYNVMVEFVGIGQTMIAHVPSGATQTASISWTATPAGSHWITVIADSEQTIPEFNELNNVASSRIYVSQPDVPLPDLSISSGHITFSNVAPIPGEIVTISATISNLGDAIAESVPVVFYVDNVQIGLIHVTPQLAPGENYVISTFWVAFPVGTHEVGVRVDPGYSIIESRKDNNEASKEIYAYPAQPDLTPRNLQLSDNTPASGQTITVSVDVYNLGGVGANNVLVSFYDDSQLVGSAVIPWIAERGGVEGVVVECEFGSVGWHELTVVVDPENAINEADETNNDIAILMFVHSPAPDLTISRSDITFSDPYPTDGDPITIYAQVYNIGELDAFDVVVDFVGIGRIVIPIIQGGSTQMASISWTATPAGLHGFLVVVDPDQLIPELNEFNNLAFRSLIVYPPLPPDLLIYSSDIAFSDVTPNHGDTVTIQATIHNVGDGDANGVSVTFYLDRGTPIETATVEFIPAGGSQDVAVEWIAIQPGSHVISVVVDIEVDSNRNNNIATRAIIVASGEPQPENPDFEIHVQPIGISAVPRQANTVKVRIASLNGFSAPVLINVLPDSSEIAPSFMEISVTPDPNGFVELNLDLYVLSTHLTDHSIVVSGSSGDLQHKKTVTLTVPYMSVPYLSQADTNWCGPTSVAMIMRYYGKSIHQWDVAEALLIDHSGGFSIQWGLLSDFLSENGLETDPPTLPSAVTKEVLIDMLQRHEPVLLRIPGEVFAGWPSQFPEGHMVVLIGYSEDSDVFFVNDPSGALVKYLFGPSVYEMPFYGVPIPWSMLENYATAFSAWAWGVKGAPDVPTGVLNILGGDSTGYRSVAASHGINPWNDDVYIWWSGKVWLPLLSRYTDGLTWRNSKTHARMLDPMDYFSIANGAEPFVVVNPTDKKRQYEVEVAFSMSGAIEWSSGRQQVEVPACDSMNIPITVGKLGDILTKYGTYTISLALWCDGELVDSVDLPPIEYAQPTTTLRITAMSPLNLLITNPLGFRVGYDPTTLSVVNEIPGATYSGPETDPQIITIPSPVQGVYIIERYGIGTGAYTIVIESIAADGSIIDSESWTGTASPSEVEKGSLQLFEDCTFALLPIPHFTVSAESAGVSEPIGFDPSGSYDPDGTIVLYEWDFESDGVYDYSSATPDVVFHAYSALGTYVVTLRVTDNDGMTGTTTGAALEIIDNIPPTTALEIGEPKYVDPMDNIYITSATPFTLTAEDNPGGVGVASIFYRIYNNTFDTGWLEYSEPFYLTGLSDGKYSIDYYSTDNIGNTEPTHTISVTLDNSGPAITIENPPAGWALQDGVTFIALSTDPSGTNSLNFSIREANGDQGTPVGLEDIPATYNAITGKWEFFFNTLQLPDGFYIVLIGAEDNLGHTALIIVPYSIRNWAVLELLPASENNKAGRTMPVKFALRVAAAVDPSQPFVYNEELTIKIYATDNPSNILQTSTFGDTARDYRINTFSEKYITNFKTLKTPKTYMVEVWRKDMLIGTFGFQTVK